MEHLLKTKIQFKFFLLYFLISKINCEEIYKENINDIKYDQYNFQNKEEVCELSPGKIYNKITYSSKIYNIKFSGIKSANDLLIHFYPLECKIQLMNSNYDTENIYKLGYDNNDAFYTLIKNYKINSTSFKIKPLIFLNFFSLYS